MTRRHTFSSLAWPDDPDDQDLASFWAQELSDKVLDWTWLAFDALMSKHGKNVDFSIPLEQLERDLVRQHFIEIQLLFAADSDGFASIVPQQTSLKQALQRLPAFAERTHRVSAHARTSNPNLRLHHLAMVCETDG